MRVAGDEVMTEARCDKPLSGRVILVTRAREQAEVFARLLEAAGAQVMLVPTIAIEPPASWGPLDAALAEEHDWAVFTSVNGVAMVRRRVEATGQGRASLERSSISASSAGPSGMGSAVTSSHRSTRRRRSVSTSTRR